jgi:peroxiredoxin family protein
MNSLEAQLTPVQLAMLDEFVQQRVEHRIAAVEAQLTELTNQCARLNNRTPDGLAMIVFSGDLDKLITGFSLATAAAAQGVSVSMFFAFWGLVAVKQSATSKGKSWAGKILAKVLPSGPRAAPTSHLNYFGIGSRLFKYLMRKHKAPSLEELIAAAQELDVRFVVCQNSIEIMGIASEEIINGVEFAGVGSFLTTALNSKMTLFI